MKSLFKEKQGDDAVKTFIFSTFNKKKRGMVIMTATLALMDCGAAKFTFMGSQYVLLVYGSTLFSSSTFYSRE